MNIYLIGFMGSGKSFIGKQLSEQLNFEFCDLDERIETAKNQSIASIFENKGETYFRKLESTILQKTANLKNTIIATGGGTACFFDNMEWMNENGKTIF
ncbi:MAG: shikimate kinase [Saprospiraceae bacterium]|nr:shikimate kinase [Saprospiraceae bacterium]